MRPAASADVPLSQPAGIGSGAPTACADPVVPRVVTVKLGWTVARRGRREVEVDGVRVPGSATARLRPGSTTPPTSLTNWMPPAPPLAEATSLT